MSQKHEDLTLLSVRSAFDHLQSTINRALQRVERQSQLNHSALFSEIKERRKLAKALHLDRRLIHLYRRLSSSPTLKIEGEGSLIHCEISSSVVTHEGNDQTIRFQLNDNNYSLQFSDRGGACISYYGETFKSSHLSLYAAGNEEVLTIHLNLEGEGDQETISETQITSFVPGKWIYDIIHAYETLVTTEKLKIIGRSYSDEKLEILKRKFGIEG